MEKEIYRIGIDARLFGTAQAAGIGRHNEELIRQLVKYDTENQYHLFLSPAVIPGFPIYAPNLSQIGVPFGHYTYSEQIFFPSILKQANLDLIHYTNFNSPIFFTGVPSIVTIYDLTLWFFSGRQRRSWLERMLYRLVIKKTCHNAKHIIAITQKTKDDIIKFLKVDPEKITVIYPGVTKDYHPISDDSRINNLKRRFDITKPYLIYVGQWRDHKNVIRLIRAFGLLRRRYNFDYQLVLVGKIDNRYPQVPTTIKELGFKEDVILTGYVSDLDLPYLYSGAEFFVFPSLYEGFGIPPLEAMSCGLPVLSSNLSCMPEVLGEAVYYFDPLNIESMAKAMSEVAKSYTLKRELRLKGLKQAKRYSFDKTARKTIKIYQKVLKSL